ncbi:NADPH HC-toxin reductase 1-like [Ziziphus jujuba]|uniref:NADPH HC-toxin reductase 1-like n=1 Tax=Ziziphus jujuba TaxID=326968 RepID=A0ABM4AB15_ZIZJJ|nr:NADPH HC-toxin reductase 1-like [Ziziphus jujuba]
MEKKKEKCRVCVTGGSGYIGSWLVKRLLEKCYNVYATLRNLEDASKVGILKSLPHAETNLVLFQADIYNPIDFKNAIKGCEFVFHVATPMLHNSQTSLYKDTAEAAVAGVRSIANSCIRSQTVKLLIYNASCMSASQLMEDGAGVKSCVDDSCWTPLNVSFAYASDFLLAYTRSKTLVEKEILSYNEISMIIVVCPTSVDLSLQVWEFDQAHQRWLPVTEWALPDDKGDTVYAVAWAPNIGRPYEVIAVATYKGITIWHLGLKPDPYGRLSTEKVALLSGHEGEVWQMEWDMSGMTLVTTGYDGVVRLWQSNLNAAWHEQAAFEATT